jgi:polar amino acid transport system permease protein
MATETATQETTPSRHPLPDTVALPHYYGRWATAACIAVLLYLIIRSLANNQNLAWHVVGEYIFNGQILIGLRQTLLLSVISMLLAIVVGIAFGFCRLSGNPILRYGGTLYIWVFRSVPALIQILFWGNIALFAPVITIGIPGTNISFYSVSTNDVISVFTASVIALTLANGCYLAEIVRSGILSVDDGQRVAARALGLGWWQTQRKVVLPQAVRIILPPTGNRFIGLLKETSLVSVIAGGDLLGTAENISGLNLRTIELLIVAAIWYLVVTSLSSLGQSVMERRLSKAHQAIS